jgi:hypothetical protein
MMRPPQICARADNGSDFKPLKIDGFLSGHSNSKQPPNIIRLFHYAKHVAKRATDSIAPEASLIRDAKRRAA